MAAEVETDSKSMRSETPLVQSPDGKSWGMIPDCLAPYAGSGIIRAAEIIVPLGNQAEGWRHIWHKHLANIAHFHPSLTVEAYLQNVLRRFQRLYLQPDGSLWLFRSNGTTKCAVVAPSSFDGRPVYKLVTAYPIPREPNFARRNAIRLHVK